MLIVVFEYEIFGEKVSIFGWLNIKLIVVLENLVVVCEIFDILVDVFEDYLSFVVEVFWYVII